MASKRHQRRRACESKTAYPERYQAVEVLKRLKPAYSGGTYKCNFCGNWHIGRAQARYINARVGK